MTNETGSSKPTDTDIMDRLFLELSQFTKATTGKELHYEKTLAAIRDGAENPAKLAGDALGVRAVS